MLWLPDVDRRTEEELAGYLEKGKAPEDPWSRPYVYLSPGVKNKDFDLKSLGSDGEEGGEGENADIER